MLTKDMKKLDTGMHALKSSSVLIAKQFILWKQVIYVSCVKFSLKNLTNINYKHMSIAEAIMSQWTMTGRAI